MKIENDLLGELACPENLAALVQRVRDNELPWVVVSSAAIDSWQRRDPDAWAKVAEWLSAKGVAVVRL